MYKTPYAGWIPIAEKVFVVHDRVFTAQLGQVADGAWPDKLYNIFYCITDEPDLGILTTVFGSFWSRPRRYSAGSPFVESVCKRWGQGNDAPSGYHFSEEGDPDPWHKGTPGGPGFVLLYDGEQELFVEEEFFIHFVYQAIQTFANLAQEALCDRQMALDLRTNASRVKQAFPNLTL